MKLIDILVRELPKMGGWPEGAECAVQDSDGQLCFSSHRNVTLNTLKTDWFDGDWVGGWSNPYLNEIADDRDGSIVARDQYEAALAQRQLVDSWNGEGLPPVGCDCELSHGVCMYTSDGTCEFEAGTKVKVGGRANFGYGDKAVVVVSGTSVICDVAPEFLRPLRTEADKKRDETVGRMLDFYFKDGGDTPNEYDLSAMRDVYDAIASGKIPGVKLED